MHLLYVCVAYVLTGWQFNSSGACTDIPQQPPGAAPPNAKRSCVASYPTAVSEALLWVWADSGPNAEAEAAATPLRGMAPEADE
jgi:phenylpropionate dioxygenase-like ring-hydroxylating dioxygenase large terminal subunit